MARNGLSPHRIDRVVYGRVIPVLDEFNEALQTLASEPNREASASVPIAAIDSLQVPAAAGPYLARMGLESPESLRQRPLRRLVVFALHRSGIL
jgi:hypothetical protein